ncbi:uncharacterized protein [Nicotiana tomentosiformis]|uniref:uncharacterized protein n=1 Tax=Nicotiana tomentosiformis TaxID=4098 RepID=UPI00051C6FBA|nr:uncharacterized protein LOC104087539 [Nicotiana tomentosiformis]
MKKFSTKQFYLKLRGTFQKVAWRKLMCNNQGLPKWIFILRLAALGRLYTKDRLFKWGVTQDQFCLLCGQDHESLAHLFFTCETTAQLWKKLLNWIGVTRNPMVWEDELQWGMQHASGSSSRAEVYRMLLAVAVYHVWMERNYRVFQGKQQSIEVVARPIVQEIHFRDSMKVKIAKWLESLNYYPA